MRPLFLVPVALLLSLPAPAAERLPSAIAGPVRVVDADTFDVGDVRVRLFGVDAPEGGQTCGDEGWDCGAWATAWAEGRWQGAEAVCERVDTDRHGRAVARCAVAGEDAGAALVLAGAAVAYREFSGDYVPQEDAARAAGAGLWSGAFVTPADWRAGERSEAAASGACDIKGNVSENGHIYHVPGSRHYDRTRIAEGDGERWFCSVAEAEAAGWRAPRS